LPVKTPNGISFNIDVKGSISGNVFFPIRPREPKPDLYYIIVYAPREKDRDTGESTYVQPKFYIISSADAMDTMKKNQEEWWKKKSPDVHEKYRAKYGEDCKNAWAGLDMRKLEEDRWDRLPG
jgi:hypothetical protein